MSGAARPAVAGAQRWLALGALAGVAIAAATLVRSGPQAPHGAVDLGTVAIVNGQPISREALARFTGALAQQRGRIDLDPGERRRILGRLVDEELLLQRGLALGLDRSEPTARRAIVSAVVDSLAADPIPAPTRAELDAFYRAHAADFAPGGGAPPPLDAVLEPVTQAWIQQQHDARVEQALAALRASASIVITDPALAAPP